MKRVLGSITLISKDYLDRASGLIEKAVTSREDSGIKQWDNYYPDKQILIEDIQSKQLYGCILDEVLLGIITLNEIQDQAYQTINWQFNGDKVLTIHRLCVDPKFRRVNVGKKMILFAESLAIQNEYSSIRLDVFSENLATNLFYQELGYLTNAPIFLEKGKFNTYEKEVSDLKSITRLKKWTL